MGLPYLTSFDQVATVFADYGASLRGIVRYKLTQKNLKPYIEGKKLKVLDIGGGSGPDAGWLAMEGHQVTLLEPSKKQREFAERRFKFFLPDEARQSIDIKACTLEELTKKQKYDLVLVHGVAMYQDKPDKFITEAASYVKKGGIISLVEKGYHGALSRAIRRNDLSEYHRIQETRRSTNYLGHEVYSFLPEDMEKVLNDNGFKVLEWSGVRMITDDIKMKVADMNKDDITDILEAEFEFSHHPGMRAYGQLLHFIARKK